MKKFIKKCFLFAAPLVLLAVPAILLDPFRVFFQYDPYYPPPEEELVQFNRNIACLQTFEANRNKYPYNAFVLGSSRSQAFKCNAWKRHLGEQAVPFHFSNFGEVIYGVRNKLVYLDEQGVDIEHVLLVVDEALLKRTRNNKQFKNTSPPALSKESPVKFYKALFDAYTQKGFIIGYIDYKLFHVRRDYMNELFPFREIPSTHDPVTCDYTYGYDVQLAEDEDAYYEGVKDVFYVREKTERQQGDEITKEEIAIVQQIQRIFQKHQTDYRIVISPLYDQIPLNKNQLNLLKEYFDAERIYDFSGVNRFTENYRNYYETSHYRPHVAEEIMQIVYGESDKTKSEPLISNNIHSLNR